MNFFYVTVVIGIHIAISVYSDNILPEQSDVVTLSDDITEVACNSSLQPAVVTWPGLILPPVYSNGTYLPDQDCRWLLTAPQGSIVSLDFLYIELVEVFRCHFANLSVYDGDSPSAHKMLLLCGHDDSPVLHSSQTHVLLVFLSGRVTEGRGFHAHFNTTDIHERGCVGRDFVSGDWENGGLYSPDWPAHYPTDMLCEWRITANQPVRLEFLDFDLGEGDSDGQCVADHVSVYDLDPIEEAVHLGTYCGPHTPYHLGSTSAGLLVRFVSGNQNEGNHAGFRLRFLVTNTTERACGGAGPVELDWAPGLIMSPPTDSSYCTWRLTAPITRLIRLSVRSFDLPECTQCGCAGLEIYSGPTHNSPLIGRYCGTGWEEPIAIGNNQVYLQYDSYNLNGHKGFEVLYEYEDISEEACGRDKPVELTHDDGVITSPNYNQGNYPNNANCQWLVSTSFGYAVTLDFQDLELEHCDRCECDYLSVHNGDEPSASHTHINTYCGNYAPNPITSTLPAIFLTLLTDKSNTYRGFRVNYRFTYMAEKACGPAQPLGMSHDPGQILSEGYELGANYKSNSDCFWLISAESKQTVSLYLRDFELEGGHLCEFDYVILYDGMDNSAAVIERLCDEVEPSVYQSSGQRMYITFHSNEVIEKKGFFFEYHFNKSSGSSGIGFLPAVLVCIVLLGVLTLIGAYCRVSSRFTKFKAWFNRVTGRNRSNESETPAAPTSNVRQARQSESDQNNTAFVPAPARSVICPPSDIDNMHYFAIADFPPPTYEEATGGTNQNTGNSGQEEQETSLSDRPADTVNGRSATTLNIPDTGMASRETTERVNGGTVTTQQLLNSANAGNSSGESIRSSTDQSTLQDSTPSTPGQVPGQTNTVNQANGATSQLVYPGSSRGTNARTTSNSISTEPSTSNHMASNSYHRDIQTNASTLGNPDMGLSLLRQTGLYSRNRVTEGGGGNTNKQGTSSNNQYPGTVPSSQVPTMQRSQSVDGMLNSDPSNDISNRNQRRSVSTEHLDQSTGVRDIYNPLYSSLQERRTDCLSQTCDQQQVKDTPKGQGELGCVKISSHQKKKSGSRENEDAFHTGKENVGFIGDHDNSSQEDVNTNIVLHRLESRDRDTSV